MPFARFLVLDLISCLIWVIVLAGAGYFFTGAALLFKENKIIAGIILALVVISLYLVERYWLSKRVEEANPETLERIEEKLHEIEDTAQEKLHELGERLHLSKHQEDRKGKAKKHDKDE